MANNDNHVLPTSPPIYSSSSSADTVFPEDVDMSSFSDSDESAESRPVDACNEEMEIDLLLPLLDELRSVVPHSSPRIAAEADSLLADAIAYIRDLELKVQRLEEEEEEREDEGKVEVEVMVVHGNEAVIRARSFDCDHPSARLFGVLRELGAEVRRASVTGMEDMVVHGVTARVPGALADADVLAAALLAAVNV